VKVDPVKCGPRLKLRKWRHLPASKLTRAERNMRFVETYCKVPEGDLVGQPVVLANFQEKFFRDVYDNPHGTSNAYLSMARKNAKTATIGFIVLVHLVGPEAQRNSHIQSGALSREQASQVYKYASKTVQLSPELSGIVRTVPSGKKLIGLPMNVEYAASSAEAKTAHGGSPILAILDETGQVRGPQDDFIDAIITSQGAYENPLLIVISTQAANDGDLLSIWLDDAERSQDPHTVSHVYAAPQDCDLMDRKAWAAANPALGLFRSLSDVEKQMERAARMPSSENTARNLILNQRVSTVSPFVSKSVWDANSGRVIDFGDTPVYAGLDLSARTDLTALVIIGKIAGVWHVVPHFWTPESGLHDRAKRDRQPYDVWARQDYLHTTPGATVDYEFVAQDMAAILAELNVQAIAYDRWRITLLQKEFDTLGIDLPLVECGQGFKDMSPAIDALESELLNGRIAHGNQPVLTMCAANAVISKDAAGNRKLDKHKATGRIDGMVALAMAFSAAGGAEHEPDLSDFLSDPIIV
jgi:phage terminase large subunit-like protein